MTTVAIKQVNEVRVEARVTGWPGHWDFYLVEVQPGQGMQGTRVGEGRPHWSTSKVAAERNAKALLKNYR